jgi:hypothetical protein
MNNLRKIFESRPPQAVRFSAELIESLTLSRHTLIDSIEDDLMYASPTWQQFLNRFEKSLKNEDIHNFLQWTVVKNTMFSENHAVAKGELIEILSCKEFITTWLPGLSESPVGNPDLFQGFPLTSSNRIHKTHHLWAFMKSSGADLSCYENFVEVGAGYGLLPLIAKCIGLAGNWTLVDFKIMTFLQNWYLQQNGLNEVTFSTPSAYLSNNKYRSQGKTLLISTWALSEVPLNQRQEYLEIASEWDLLFAYQQEFDQVDNNKWFEDFVRSNQRRKFFKRDIPGLAGHSYLFGLIQ